MLVELLRFPRRKAAKPVAGTHSPSVPMVVFGRNSKGEPVVSFREAKQYLGLEPDAPVVGETGYDMQNARNEGALSSGDLLTVTRAHQIGHPITEHVVYLGEASRQGGIGAQAFTRRAPSTESFILEATDIVAWGKVVPSTNGAVEVGIPTGKTMPQASSLR